MRLCILLASLIFLFQSVVGGPPSCSFFLSLPLKFELASARMPVNRAEGMYNPDLCLLELASLHFLLLVTGDCQDMSKPQLACWVTIHTSLSPEPGVV